MVDGVKCCIEVKEEENAERAGIGGKQEVVGDF